MDQVFKGLPEALQWEILTDFVGGYTVRYKKLRRSLSDVLKFQILRNTYGINPTRPPSGFFKNFVVSITMPHNYDMEYTLVEAQLEFSHKKKFAMLFRNISTNQYSYGYKGYSSNQLTITPIDDSVILPPYERHYYPSFPNTNKKLGRSIQMMELFNPLIYKERSFWRLYSLPNGLELGLIVASGLGIVFWSDVERLLELADVVLLGKIEIVLIGAMGLCGYLERQFMVRFGYIPLLHSWLRKD